MSKKLIILIICASILLSGCAVSGNGTLVTTYVDKETGVNYIIAGDAICPRYNADGSLYITSK